MKFIEQLFGHHDLGEKNEGTLGNTRFTREQYIDLRNHGYRIVVLTDDSLDSIRRRGTSIVGRMVSHINMHEKTGTREVAIKPDEFYLPDSNGKTLFGQMKELEEYNRQLTSEVPGVYARMGTPAEIASILDGGVLFGSERSPLNVVTRTSEVMGEGNHVVLGRGSDANGLYVNAIGDGVGLLGLRLAPVIVPA